MKAQIKKFTVSRITTFFGKSMLFAAVLAIGSCDKDDKDAPAPVKTQPTVGVADITVTAGGEEFKVSGPCGWAVAGGVNYIGANHAQNNLRVFEANFNINTLPTQTTTYTLVESIFDEDPTHITMYVTEVRSDGYTEWASRDTSGTLTLVVNGNEITANLSGITLQTSSASTNPGALNNPGALSGTLKFYR